MSQHYRQHVRTCAHISSGHNINTYKRIRHLASRHDVSSLRVLCVEFCSHDSEVALSPDLRNSWAPLGAPEGRSHAFSVGKRARRQ
eukprot:7231317-Pyramimonas_sp.AAC.1